MFTELRKFYFKVFFGLVIQNTVRPPYIHYYSYILRVVKKKVLEEKYLIKTKYDVYTKKGSDYQNEQYEQDVIKWLDECSLKSADSNGGRGWRKRMTSGCDGITLRCLQGCLKVVRANYACKGNQLVVGHHLKTLQGKCDKKTTCEVPSPKKTLECQSSIADADKTLMLTYRCDGG